MERNEKKKDTDNEMSENCEFGDQYCIIWAKPVDTSIAEVRNYAIDKSG